MLIIYYFSLAISKFLNYRWCFMFLQAEWLPRNAIMGAVEFLIEKTEGRRKKTMTLKWFSGRLGREKSDCQSHSGGHSKYMDKNISTSHAFILHLNYVIFEVFLADEHWTTGPKIIIEATWFFLICTSSSSDHTFLIVLMVEVPSSKWNLGKLPSSKRDNKIRPIGNFIQRKKLFRPRKECRSRKKKVC